jgi:hypothetical protein
MTIKHVAPAATLLAPVLVVIGAVMAHAESSTDQEVVTDQEIVSEGLALAERVYNSNDPIKARSALTVEEQDLLDSVTQPSTFDVEFRSSISPAQNLARFTGCWALNQKVEAQALLGNTLYTYWQTTQVCANYGTVTSVAVTYADGETSTPGWKIGRAPTKSAKNVGWEGRGLARYYFVLGAGPWDLQHPSDCIQQRLNANGRDHRYTPSCNLDAR